MFAGKKLFPLALKWVTENDKEVFCLHFYFQDISENY